MIEEEWKKKAFSGGQRCEIDCFGKLESLFQVSFKVCWRAFRVLTTVWELKYLNFLPLRLCLL